MRRIFYQIMIIFVIIFGISCSNVNANYYPKYYIDEVEYVYIGEDDVGKYYLDSKSISVGIYDSISVNVKLELNEPMDMGDGPIPVYILTKQTFYGKTNETALTDKTVYIFNATNHRLLDKVDNEDYDKIKPIQPGSIDEIISNNLYSQLHANEQKKTEIKNDNHIGIKKYGAIIWTATFFIPFYIFRRIFSTGSRFRYVKIIIFTLITVVIIRKILIDI